MTDYALQQRRILTPRMTRGENIAFIIAFSLIAIIILFMGGGELI